MTNKKEVLIVSGGELPDRKYQEYKIVNTTLQKRHEVITPINDLVTSLPNAIP